MPEEDLHTLDGFMAQTTDELLAKDIETLSYGLQLLAKRLWEITQRMKTLRPAIEEYNALKYEAMALRDIKSSWQSIQRTLREM